MTERHHDEIARRLRESGTVPAPERLRAEVMDQVRAEPRLRPSRRSFLVPVMPYAAAAALLAVLVFAISHAGGGGFSGSASSGAGGGTGSGGGAQAPETAKRSGDMSTPGLAEGQSVFHLSAGAAREFAQAHDLTTLSPTDRTLVLVVPRSRFAAYQDRLRRIERRSQADRIRVILRRAP